MRWIPFIILTYFILLLQTSVVGLISFSFGSVGTVEPDLLAIVAVFVALSARNGVDVMLAAWALGLAADLTTGGGAGAATALGPMSLAYMLGAGAVFKVREAFFRDRPFTKGMLVLTFCLLAHPTWVTLQTLRASGAMGWSDYGKLLVQALMLSLYTAVLSPFVFVVLSKLSGWILPPQGRGLRRSYR